MNLEVLVVDDNDMLQFLHKKMLSMSEIASCPRTFSNGKQALEFLIENKQPETEYLVFLDLNMPVMNGFTFLENLEVLQYKENVHVIIVSSSVEEYDEHKLRKIAHLSSVLDFVEKPLRFKDCERIKKMDALQKFFINYKELASQTRG